MVSFTKSVALAALAVAGASADMDMNMTHGNMTHTTDCAALGGVKKGSGNGDHGRLLAEGMLGCPVLEGLAELDDSNAWVGIKCKDDGFEMRKCPKSNLACTDGDVTTRNFYTAFGLDTHSDDENCYRVICTSDSYKIGHFQASCDSVKANKTAHHCDPHHGCEILSGKSTDSGDAAALSVSAALAGLALAGAAFVM